MGEQLLVSEYELLDARNTYMPSHIRRQMLGYSASLKALQMHKGNCVKVESPFDDSYPTIDLYNQT